MRRWNGSHFLHLHQILGWSQRSFHLHILSVGTRVVARCHQQHLLSRAGVCTACRPTLHVLFAPAVCVSSDLSSRVFRSVSFLLLLSTCVSFLVVHVWRLPSIPTAFFRRSRFAWRLVPLLPPRHSSPFPSRRRGYVHAHAPRGGATLFLDNPCAEDDPKPTSKKSPPL